VYEALVHDQPGVDQGCEHPEQETGVRGAVAWAGDAFVDAIDV
jgi:hypothetical protein